MANTPWVGGSKLYLQSGTLTGTIKTSVTISGVNSAPQGISWDGTDTPWSGTGSTGGEKLYIGSIIWKGYLDSIFSFNKTNTTCLCMYPVFGTEIRIFLSLGFVY